MTKDAVAKDWGGLLTVAGGRLYSDPANAPGTPATLWVDAATGSDSNTRAAVRAGGGTVK